MHVGHRVYVYTCAYMCTCACACVCAGLMTQLIYVATFYQYIYMHDHECSHSNVVLGIATQS